MTLREQRGRPSKISLAASLLGPRGAAAGGRARALSAERRSEIATSGGEVGGARRAAALSPAKRAAIARKAAAARWPKRGAA